MPSARRNMMVHSFPTPLQDEVLWLFGGNVDDVVSNEILKLVCHSKPETSAGSCEWIKVEQKLKIPRKGTHLAPVISLP